MEGSAQSWRQRPQGRERRRKRSSGPSPITIRGATNSNSNSNGNGQNKSQSSQQSNQSEFPFNVEIPNYYRVTKNNDASASAIIISENGGDGNQGSLLVDGLDLNDVCTPLKDEVAGDEKLPGGKTPDNHSTVNSETESKEKPSAEDLKAKRHDKFIAALEKYGSSESAWYAMASELEWSAEDVKVHAYSYFKSLVQERKREMYDTLVEGKDCEKESPKNNKKSNVDDVCASWSSHELILLDSLMMKYCKDLSCLDVKQNNEAVIKDESHHLSKRQMTVWEKIASQFPGKKSCECKKQGITRLLSVYNKKEKNPKPHLGFTTHHAPIPYRPPALTMSVHKALHASPNAAVAKSFSIDEKALSSLIGQTKRKYAPRRCMTCFRNKGQDWPHLYTCKGRSPNGACQYFFQK